MKKIPTLFVRNPERRSELLNQVTPGCEWVLSGEGTAMQKLDGTCCMIRDGVLYKRREVKKGKSDPPGFELSEEDTNTGKRFGWVLVGDGPEDKYHILALPNEVLADGTYELVGPKIQGNAERYSDHCLVSHGSVPLNRIRRTFESLSLMFRGDFPYEGVVWHHPDGRMAKLKKKDFIHD